MAAFRLLLACVEPLYDTAVFEHSLYLVPPFRRAEALRYRHVRDRCLSLAAALLLTLAARHDGLAVDALHFTKSVYGKPLCVERPDWHFNLSRSGSLAVCFSGPCALGVDVQVLKDMPHCSFDAWLHASEKAWLTQWGHVYPEILARLWTRKEAFLKAVGAGFSIDPAAVSVLHGQAPLWQGQSYHFEEYSLSGHALAVCLPRGRAFPPLQHMDMRDVVSSLSARAGSAA